MAVAIFEGPCTRFVTYHDLSEDLPVLAKRNKLVVNDELANVHVTNDAEVTC